MNDRKIAIVTGAYKGTGLIISDFLLKKNYKVYCLDNKYKKKIQVLNDKTYYKIDLSKIIEIKLFVNFLKQREKKIDCLVNNAGVTLKKTKKNFVDYWFKTLNINLNSIFFLSEMLVPLLKKSDNPSIVNISSIAAKIAMSQNPAYNASKSGVLALTSSQALDYSNYKIRANAICPGYIKTDMTKKSFNNRKLKSLRLNRMINKRYGSSEEVAELTYFLCSKKSKYINGQDIVIDGGFLKKGI